jgi:hypothetical protein
MSSPVSAADVYEFHFWGQEKSHRGYHPHARNPPERTPMNTVSPF